MCNNHLGVGCVRLMHSRWRLHPHDGGGDSDGAQDWDFIPGWTPACQSSHRRRGDTRGAGGGQASCQVGSQIQHQDEKKTSGFVLSWHLLVSRVSGCVDHFALEEKDAYECTRNIISTLNFLLPEEEEAARRRKEEEEPRYCPEELLGLAPRSYNHSLDVKMVQIKCIH